MAHKKYWLLAALPLPAYQQAAVEIFGLSLGEKPREHIEKLFVERLIFLSILSPRLGDSLRADEFRKLCGVFFIAGIIHIVSSYTKD